MMRGNSFAFRLHPSLLAELRKAAAAEGVSVDHYLNVAVAEKLAARRTAAAYFAERAGRGRADRALDILDAAGSDEAEADSGDLLPPPPHRD